MREILTRTLTQLRAVFRTESVVEAVRPVEVELPDWVTDAWADPSWNPTPEEQAVLDALDADDFDQFPGEVRP